MDDTASMIQQTSDDRRRRFQISWKKSREDRAGTIPYHKPTLAVPFWLSDYRLSNLASPLWSGTPMSSFVVDVYLEYLLLSHFMLHLVHSIATPCHYCFLGKFECWLVRITTFQSEQFASSPMYILMEDWTIVRRCWREGNFVVVIFAMEVSS